MQDAPLPVGRSEECPKCASDVRVCKNCSFYDPAYYNACRETQAEPCPEKERANFCSFFKLKPATDTPNPDTSSSNDDPKQQFAKLFSAD